MNRNRTIAGAPIRSAANAWQLVSTLLAETLERSPAIPTGSVATELAPLRGLGPALIAGGHFESKGLVLIDAGLHLTVFVMTADAALAVDENLNPVPGGAGATNHWTLHLPSAGPLDASIAAAVKRSPHLSADTPPTTVPAAKAEDHSRQSPIDLEALHNAEKLQ